jgi:hypothetical protein
MLQSEVIVLYFGETCFDIGFTQEKTTVPLPLFSVKLSEMSFLIDVWFLNTIPLEFWQKNQDGGDIRVGQKSLFFT